MKVIEQNGFVSAFGGYPNPILPYGKMVPPKRLMLLIPALFAQYWLYGPFSPLFNAGYSFLSRG
jgi:hypothetical protein